jgi:hypothetical protein
LVRSRGQRIFEIVLWIHWVFQFVSRTLDILDDINLISDYKFIFTKSTFFFSKFITEMSQNVSTLFRLSRFSGFVSIFVQIFLDLSLRVSSSTVPSSTVLRSHQTITALYFGHIFKSWEHTLKLTEYLNFCYI